MEMYLIGRLFAVDILHIPECTMIWMSAFSYSSGCCMVVYFGIGFEESSRVEQVTETLNSDTSGKS